MEKTSPNYPNYQPREDNSKPTVWNFKRSDKFKSVVYANVSFPSFHNWFRDWKSSLIRIS